jgi:hypothetical protein
MNRLSTPVLFISVLFFLTCCSSSKFYDSPRPENTSTGFEGRAAGPKEENHSPAFKKRMEAKESLGNWFFIRGGNEGEKN